MHSVSRHAMTLHLPKRQDLGRSMPPPGRVPGTDMILVEKAGALQMNVVGSTQAPMPLDLAFGSGKTGMTYVAFDGAEALELHKSYFPRLHRWYLTPGHEQQKPTDLALRHTKAVTQQCILCHAVALPSVGMTPEPRFFGVGCESCHGPGGAHVAAMRLGSRGDISIERLSRLDATSLNNLCARCHRSAKDVMIHSEQAKMTNRFQPYGLMKSRCFLESGNKLSCLTCHNPHTDASKDTKTYEAICLTCHSGAKNGASAQPVTQQRACPVDRTTGCIGCHMPKRNAFSQNDLPTTMADHYIRVIAHHAQ